MFVISQEKLNELDQAQNQEFLYDLVYEIIKENPALKLNGQFDELIEPVQNLMNQYLQKGINQINTLKYMVKSHVYLGIDYENDPYFAWIKQEMEDYNIEEQVTYVDAFYEILESYKKEVIGKDFEYLIEATHQLELVRDLSNSTKYLEDVYPRKIAFLKEKGSTLDLNNQNLTYDKILAKEFVLGNKFKNNIFIKNILNWEN